MTVNPSADFASAELEIVQEQQLKEKIVNEEFKIWKKTVPLLYDTIHTHALDFPSLSLQWLPDYTVSENKNYVTVKFLFGTNTSQHSQDYLKLGSLSLPSTLAPDFAEFSPNSQSIPIPMSNIDSSDNFRILSSWKHNGEINKLRISPNNEKVITFDNEGVVHLYDLKSNNKEAVDFKYHKLEGYALEWIDENQFLSGANDSQIALWDVSKPSTPIQRFKSHNAVINDLSHNTQEKSLFGSVADDYSYQIHDLRASFQDNPAIKMETSHIQNSFAFNPEIPTLFATGGKENVVSLYDLRNPSEPFRKLFGHNDSVIGIEWNKNNDPNKLISWGLDKRAISWDLSYLSDEFTYPTNEPTEGSKRRYTKNVDPCLAFIHGGHTNRINEVDIHPKINGLTATCGDDNLIEIWKSKTIQLENEEEEEEEGEEESEKLTSPAENNTEGSKTDASNNLENEDTVMKD
ncbi:uncharacterized protein AC631_04751 [Debaryomyces fabryi]|uniref:Histone-binding protein RBBP4-like N-terminal domain-containing protein n=1 Tax=Debaryomyces fabryi TaxID=58627 RepID=A0A0V1PTA0_9ASCO|nr:uncharacterized protein AC631_04751 [Debaryomyces fabryi]KRZ99500.1 hypothetical protein AC631_04751 [Debaryomyces fabryi]CUM54109.1 unnamed protein product [Debaryomyces fabryi]